MCKFISAIKKDNNYFYLTKQDLKGKRFKEFKEHNPNWYEDIKGHGAIEFFYPELKGKGSHWECRYFFSPNNFPACIVEDIKKGNFEGIGVCLDILNKEGLEEYEKIQRPALEEYRKIEQSALIEYRKIQLHALEEYRKIEQFAFWKIAVQKKYRKKQWK